MSIFARAVEANSFTAAARALLIDPASVSKAIKALEAELGVLLFARSTRSLKLTPEGTRFYRDCVHILTKFGEATRQFRTDLAAPQGRLKVGMAPGLSRRIVLRAIPRFQQQYPQIETILFSVDDPAKIQDREIDVFVRPHRLRQRGGLPPQSQGLIVRKLAQTRFVICASPEYLDRNKRAIHAPADLLHHACVGTVTLERDIQDEWLFVKSSLRQKIKFVPKLLVHGAEAVREAGLANCGIIRTLAGGVEDELRSRKLVRVLADWECSGAPPYMAIYRKSRPMPPQIDVFVRYLADAFRRYDQPTNPALETGPTPP